MGPRAIAPNPGAASLTLTGFQNNSLPSVTYLFERALTTGDADDVVWVNNQEEELITAWGFYDDTEGPAGHAVG